ncbi:unnamed protein product, partial [Allacma fusca]
VAVIVLAAVVACANAGYLRSPIAYAPAPVIRTVAYAPAPVIRTVAYAPAVKTVLA